MRQGVDFDKKLRVKGNWKRKKKLQRGEKINFEIRVKVIFVSSAAKTQVPFFAMLKSSRTIESGGVGARPRLIGVALVRELAAMLYWSEHAS